MSAPAPLPGARLLFTLDPTVGYLNHGSFGAAPVVTQQAQRRLREEMEANPVRFFTRGLDERIEHARRHLASFLGAAPQRTAFVANTTTGVSMVLRSLRLGVGDEIVTTDHGYGAVDLAVDQFCAATGARQVTVPVPLEADDDAIVAAINGAVHPSRTRLVIVDMITSPTARLFPVEKISAALRSSGVPVLVDAAHAPGSTPVDVAAIGADFFVGNLHKWAYAPRGTAILSVAPQWTTRIEPPVISWRVHEGFPRSVEFLGTLDYTGWLAAPTGLYALRSLGVERVRRHNAALVEHGQRLVGAALGLDPAELPDPGAPLPMRIVPLPVPAAGPETGTALRDRISDELRTEVAVNVWRGRMLLRLSAQVYNTEAEYQRLADGLPALLRQLR